jgi:hypothetical protein
MPSSGICTPAESCKNRRFGGMYRLHNEGDNELGTMLAVTSNLRTLHGVNIPQGGILDSHRRVNLKAYIALTGWTL